MVEQWLDPRVSQRLQQVLQLSTAPATMSEFWQLAEKEYLGIPENKEFMEQVRAGKAVIAETDEDTGYSLALPDGSNPKVECAGDALGTALLRHVDIVHARCPHCGEKMQIKIEGKRVVNASLPSIVFWMGGSAKTGIVMLEGKDIPEDPVCYHIHLFPNRDHLAAWLQAKSDEFGFTVSLNDIVELWVQFLYNR